MAKCQHEIVLVERILVLTGAVHVASAVAAMIASYGRCAWTDWAEKLRSLLLARTIASEIFQSSHRLPRVKTSCQGTKDARAERRSIGGVRKADFTTTRLYTDYTG